MAKGNMLLGYSRGSVGDVTFYRSKGAQQARARNRKPTNPRSTKQMLQRSLLANCVKFYKVATKGLFKFAFENKKPNESDYNAFVRVNIKRGINISKTAFDTEWYGGIGYWRMTEGSMQSIATLMSNSKLHFDFGVETTETVPTNTTVGWLSSQLINGNPNRYMAGDIITFCGVIFRTPGNGMPSVQPTASNDNFDTSFGTVQFRLNTADTTEVADATGATCHAVKVGNKLCLGLTPSESAAASFWAQGIQGACLIHSRNTSEGTKVSTQDLATNDNWNTAVEAGKNTDYISAVLADWQSTGEAILQGGASTDFENPFDYATSQTRTFRCADTPSGSGGTYFNYSKTDTNVNGTVSFIGMSGIDNSRPYIRTVITSVTFDNAEHAQTAFAAIENAPVTATYLGTDLDCTAQATVTNNVVEVTITLTTPNPAILQGGLFVAEIGGVTVSAELHFMTNVLTVGQQGTTRNPTTAPLLDYIPLNAPDNAYSYYFTMDTVVQTLSQEDFELVNAEQLNAGNIGDFTVLPKEENFYGIEIDYPQVQTPQQGWVVGGKFYIIYKHSPIALITVTEAE